MHRISHVERDTHETRTSLELNIDGTGKSNIFTEIGFFDHMLNQVSKHGFMDIFLNVEGDMDIDCHHTIEDAGIVFGQALREALGDREGIKRYGAAMIPMEDALAVCAIDISGRPYLVFDVQFTVPKIGDMDSEAVEEFFRAICNHAGVNIHIKLLSGRNNHHMSESIFKAFGKALCEAVTIDPRIEGTLSTRGTLE